MDRQAGNALWVIADRLTDMARDCGYPHARARTHTH